MAGLATWTRPQGGMFLLLTLAPGRNAAALLPAAMERGVVYVPGENFYPGGGGENTLRLNFVSAREAEIERGVATLARVFREAA